MTCSMKRADKARRIQAILDELADKRAEAARIEAILASDEELWNVVKTELLEIRKLYGSLDAPSWGRTPRRP